MVEKWELVTMEHLTPVVVVEVLAVNSSEEMVD
jgi:hypothetical protein